jgi:hypothetical protein
VTIGEDANTVRLSDTEWNELVRLVKTAIFARSEEISGVSSRPFLWCGGTVDP